MSSTTRCRSVVKSRRSWTPTSIDPAPDRPPDDPFRERRRHHPGEDADDVELHFLIGGARLFPVCRSPTPRRQRSLRSRRSLWPRPLGIRSVPVSAPLNASPPVRFEQTLRRIHDDHPGRRIDLHADVIDERNQHLATVALDDQVAAIDRAVHVGHPAHDRIARRPAPRSRRGRAGRTCPPAAAVSPTPASTTRRRPALRRRSCVSTPSNATTGRPW